MMFHRSTPADAGITCHQRFNQLVKLIAFIVSQALLVLALVSPPVNSAQGLVLVRRVYDGDTIAVEGGERVRYLGINAPEIAHGDNVGEPYGDKALAFNRGLVLHHRVNLEVAEHRRDRYGRLLAYVFLEDGTFVNGELVRLGYAHLLRAQISQSYWKRLLALQRQALLEKRGIWSRPALSPEEFYRGNKKSWVFHRPSCPYGHKTAQRNRVRFENRYAPLYLGFSPCRRCQP